MDHQQAQRNCSKTSRVVAVRWGYVNSSGKTTDDIRLGLSILGGSFIPPNAPTHICLTCDPVWLDIHRLAIQEYEFQRKMEEMLANESFEEADFWRTKRDEVRDQLQQAFLSLGLIEMK